MVKPEALVIHRGCPSEGVVSEHPLEGWKVFSSHIDWSNVHLMEEFCVFARYAEGSDRVVDVIRGDCAEYRVEVYSANPVLEPVIRIIPVEHVIPTVRLFLAAAVRRGSFEVADCDYRDWREGYGEKLLIPYMRISPNV